MALKRLTWNNPPDRIERELCALRLFMQHPHPNIVRLLGAWRDNDIVTLATEYIRFNDLQRDIFPALDGHTIRCMAHDLFQALAHVHSFGLIHRDVKPGNYLYDLKRRIGILIDFGLVEVASDARTDDTTVVAVHEQMRRLDGCGGLQRVSRAGTRGYRPPEVLLSVMPKTVAIDMWAAGVFLLQLLTKRPVWFPAETDADALWEVAQLLGTRRLEETAVELGRRVEFPEQAPGVEVSRVVRSMNPDFDAMGLGNAVFDLLGALLEPHPRRRITAAQALQHEFFAGWSRWLPDEAG